MKKLIVGILLLALGFILVIVLALKVNGEDLLPAILSFTKGGFFVILILTICAAFVANWRSYIILKSKGINIPFFKLLFIWFVGNAINYTTPLVYLGGEGTKAYLLNNKFNVSWNKAFSFLVIDRILEITAATFVIITSVFFFIFLYGFAGLPQTITSALLILSFGGFLVVLFHLRIFRNKKIITPMFKFLSLNKTKVGKFLFKTEHDVIRFFNYSKKAMWQAWSLSIFKQFILFLRHIMLFYFLGKGVLFVAPLISIGALYFGYLFPVPAALGIQEAFQGIVFSGFGYGAGEGLALSFIIRGAEILIVVTGILILFRYGLRMIINGVLGVLKLNNNH